MTDKQSAFIKQLEAQADIWRAEISRLAGEAKKMNAEARLATQQELEKLEAKRQEAEKQLETLRLSSVTAWQDVADGTEKAFKDMNEAVRNAVSRFAA